MHLVRYSEEGGKDILIPQIPDTSTAVQYLVGVYVLHIKLLLIIIFLPIYCRHNQWPCRCLLLIERRALFMLLLLLLLLLLLAVVTNSELRDRDTHCNYSKR